MPSLSPWQVSTRMMASAEHASSGRDHHARRCQKGWHQRHLGTPRRSGLQGQWDWSRLPKPPARGQWQSWSSWAPEAPLASQEGCQPRLLYQTVAVLALPTSETLDELLNLSVAQFSHT